MFSERSQLVLAKVQEDSSIFTCSSPSQDRHQLGFWSDYLPMLIHLVKLVALIRFGGKEHLVQFCLDFSCPGSSIPTLGRHWLSDRHFRIWTQRVTFEPWDASDIWSEWYLDKRTKRAMDQKRVPYCDVRTVSHSCNVLFPSQFALTFSFWQYKMSDINTGWW